MLNNMPRKAGNRMPPKSRLTSVGTICIDIRCGGAPRVTLGILEVV